MTASQLHVTELFTLQFLQLRTQPAAHGVRLRIQHIVLAVSH